MKTISSLLAFVSLTSSFFVFQISSETNWNNKIPIFQEKELILSNFRFCRKKAQEFWRNKAQEFWRNKALEYVAIKR